MFKVAALFLDILQMSACYERFFLIDLYLPLRLLIYLDLNCILNDYFCIWT